MDLRSNRGKIKASKRPYMKLFTSDYRDGTYGLSLELQGFYFRILTYLHDGEDVPADPIALATFLKMSSRTTRALLPKLIAAGKLYAQDGALHNPRIERDLNPSSSPTEREVEPSSTPTRTELEPNSNRRNPKDESNQDPSEHYYGEATSTAISIANSIPEDNQQPFSPRPCEKGVRGDGRTFWANALNPPEPAEHKTVTLEGDRIVLHNGTRAKWLAKFGGDEARLDLALDQAIGWIQPNSSRPLEAQVSSQLAKTLGDKLDRDGRYERTAAKAAPATNGGGVLALIDKRKGVPA